MPSFNFWTTQTVFASAILLRIILFFYGLIQDAYAPVRYTDIDYFVFTDAARYVSRGLSPYQRETYRYTPLLAWLLLPTTWSGLGWFSFGKVIFSLADVVAGWLIMLVLRSPRGGAMERERSLKFASIWLLNPMVATISTRGSSEGLLGVMVVALLWAVLQRRIAVAGVLLGLGVHFKIYPFIYAISILWYLKSPTNSPAPTRFTTISLPTYVKNFLNRERLTLAWTSFVTFAILNSSMCYIYGSAFLRHTYFYHVTRTDHRHNFSPYNTLLYLSSAGSSLPELSASISGRFFSNLRFESLAFIPQISLSAIILPFALAKRDLAGTMLAQTFAFVAFNKVCTSQYFLWYIIFLPFYLPYSTLLSSPKLGLTAAGLWIGSQALWLQQGYQLEFLGNSTFFPGLWISSLLFFLVNIWLLGIMIDDISARKTQRKTELDRDIDQLAGTLPKPSGKRFERGGQGVEAWLDGTKTTK